MSYSIVLCSNLIFHFLEIIWTPKIFNSFSSCEILILQMVELQYYYLFTYLRNTHTIHKKKLLTKVEVSKGEVHRIIEKCLKTGEVASLPGRG